MDIFQKIKYYSAVSYSLIAALFLAIFATLWILVGNHQQVAHVINITGKQRMLSQRIVMLSQMMQLSGRNDLSTKLISAINGMRVNHEYIKQIPSPQLQTILYGMRYEYDKHLNQYLDEAEKFCEHRDKQSLIYLYLLSDHMLNTADAMVFISENEYQRMIDFYKNLLAGLSLSFLILLFFVYRNITLRSLKEASAVFQALKFSEEKIRGLTNHTTSLIYIKDMEGRYRFVNPSFCRFVGKTADEILNKSDAELFSNELAEVLSRDDLAAIQNSKPLSYTDSITIDGNTYHYATDKFLLRDTEDHPYRICTISTDITEQVRANSELMETQKLLTQAQKAAKIGTWTIDAETRELVLSDYVSQFLHLEKSSDFLMLDDLIVRVCDSDIDRLVNLFENALDYGIGFTDKIHIRQPDGLCIYQIVTEAEVSNGIILKLYGTIQDITKTALDQAMMHEYVDMIDENIITSKTNKYGVITYVSQAFSRISGYEKEELVGNTHRIVRHPDTPSEIFDDIWATISNGKKWRGEIQNRGKNGESYWVYATISPNFDLNGEISGYTAIRQDISDKKRIEEISITDPLTGLYNRRYFHDIAQKEINRTVRDGHVFAFALLDIDNFKKYNDTYGHHEGDNVLIQVASSLKESFKRAHDSVFRLGGEEFGIICSAKDISSLIESVERSRSAIESIGIEHRLNIPYGTVTASYGMVTLNPSSADEEKAIDAIYKDADVQLYRAKENGRNQLCIKQP